MPSLPRVGTAAPGLDPGAARGPGQRALLLAAVRGRPLVLAFAPVFDIEMSARGMRALRAELRGLGAVLVLADEKSLRTFGPDDAPEPLHDDPEVLAKNAKRLTEAYRVDVAHGSCGLFVVDANGIVRFAKNPCHIEGVAALERALARAGRELISEARGKITRREWVVSSLIAGLTLALADGCSSAPKETPPVSPPPPRRDRISGDVDVELRVNGVAHQVRLEPRVTLLDALRERLGLVGTKKGCDQGQCGACTVLVGGRRVNACLTLALSAVGSDVTTIEGLAHGETLHPVQAAFLEEDGMQCGFCTPGQIMSAVGLLAERRPSDANDVRERMSGNICRCGAYPNIVRAVLRADGSAKRS